MKHVKTCKTQLHRAIRSVTWQNVALLINIVDSFCDFFKSSQNLSFSVFGNNKF